jgi:hypothetical protein
LITEASYFMGRDKEFPDDINDEIRANAKDLVIRVQKLLDIWGGATEVSSGWRPPSINAATPNASKKSNHMIGCAVDLKDKSGRLDDWCLANLKVLEDLGLWMEHPDKTQTDLERFGHGWCHLQSKPPKSGKRVFMP